MNVDFNLLVFVAISYVVLLFAIAFFADKRASRGQLKILRSPIVYTLSLSVYCTAWTFYGAVGNAARSGLEYLTIYLGPTLVFLGSLWLLRKLVRIGRAERITSIADLISSRYGKSTGIAAIVTILAVAGTTPYIALQLQSVTLSFAVFANPIAALESSGSVGRPETLSSTAFWVAAGLALFTILFGTRNLDTNERHSGVVMAIAFEAVVKLLALLAVGVFVVWGASDGIADMLRLIDESPVSEFAPQQSRWVGLTFLSAAAIICLPRMFQVMVVENSDEDHLNVASWAFPLYLMLISLFVLPIAVVGLAVMPEGANPDLFVLTLPLAFGQDGLAMLAFLGGFSSATSMVIVAAIALATMISNHLVIPVWLATRGQGATVSGDVRNVVLLARRISIAAILALGYTYYQVTGGTTALASIGLVSFAGVAQVLPALLGGLFWRGGTRKGAIAGLLTGFGIWAYTLFIPAIGLFPEGLLENGLFGLSFLRPQALFGANVSDPLIHSIFWSLLLNSVAYLWVSLITFPNPMERLQASAFVQVFDRSTNAKGWVEGQADAEDLLVMTQRLLGPKQAQHVFEREAARQGLAGDLPHPTVEFVDLLERELAGSVGAATAHAMVGQINGSATISVQDLMAVADESAQILEYSSQLETKSRELENTARQLQKANEKLQALSVQKDAFLSQISHELRTPMTSIRSFSEVLMESGIKKADREKYSKIIHGESLRLTRLLDDLLDLSFLENGQVVLNERDDTLQNVLDRAIVSAVDEKTTQLSVVRDADAEGISIFTDIDRLSQVFINIISNAAKYCDAEEPALEIQSRQVNGWVEIDFVDNGSGIPRDRQQIIFEKFSRASDQSSAGSAGLGLAICRQIMTRLGGDIQYLPARGGAAFRVRFPWREMAEAAE